MTSLTETLPILDDAVPALPGKVEAVARTSEEFHREAQEALELFRAKRQEAEALVEQVRQALDSVRDHAGQEQQRLEGLGRDLEQAVEEEARAVDEAAGEIRDAGEQVVDAFQALESTLVEAGDRTESAQQDARDALDALTAKATSGAPDLKSAAAAMVTAVGQTQKTVEEGQAHVTQAVNGLKDTLLRLLAGAQARLDETYQRLDDVRDQQEKAVGAATTTLDAELRTLEQELRQRLAAEVEQALAPELDAVEKALEDMGEEASRLQSEVAAAVQGMVEQLTAVAERMGPLEGGVQQVKQAAQQVGIGW